MLFHLALLAFRREAEHAMALKRIDLSDGEAA